MAKNTNNKSNCPVTRGEVDLARYEKLDRTSRELKTAAPARRALIDAKLFKLSDLKSIRLAELKELHGMGPGTIKVLLGAGAKFKK